MKYFSLLNDEELRYICSVIPQKDVRDYFRRYPKKFAKIRPGYRPQAIFKLNVSNLLFNYRNDPFISRFIENNIDLWLAQIQEHINQHLEKGKSKNVALLYTISNSYFADNIAVYFKLTNEKYSEEFIKLLSSAVQVIKEAGVNYERLEDEKAILESEYNKLEATLISKDADLNKYKERLTTTISEIKNLRKKNSILEENLISNKRDSDAVESLKKEKDHLIKKIDLLTKELTETKDEKLLLEEKLLEGLRKQQVQFINEQGQISIPKCPQDIDEFKEFLGYNLNSIGVTNNVEYFKLLIAHLSKILFKGVPIVINHKTGKNIIKCIANTLINKQTFSTLYFRNGISVEDVSEFLSSSRRIVCLDNFLGNINETELIPILEKHKDKIIFLTVMYDRTLYYLSKEFKRHYQYLNLNRIGELSVNTYLTEDPSELSEHSYSPQAPLGTSRYQDILRKILYELSYPRTLIEQCIVHIIDEDDLCHALTFDILPYYVDVIQINPFNVSETLLKYAGPNGRCRINKLLLRWYT